MRRRRRKTGSWKDRHLNFDRLGGHWVRKTYRKFGRYSRRKRR